MKCVLCDSEECVEDSHVIPAFVFRYLKKISITGHLRGGEQPNLRMGDGPKPRLLGPKGEDLLSVWEIPAPHIHCSATKFLAYLCQRRFVPDILAAFNYGTHAVLQPWRRRQQSSHALGRFLQKFDEGAYVRSRVPLGPSNFCGYGIKCRNKRAKN